MHTPSTRTLSAPAYDITGRRQRRCAVDCCDVTGGGKLVA
jgi:hypothetical protein